MAYSSSLSDAEWEVLEPVLKKLTQEKTDPTSNWMKRELLNAILYQFKSGCNWGVK